MIDQNAIESPLAGKRMFPVYQLVTVLLSLMAIGGAFFLSAAEIDVAAKTQGFSAIIAVYLSVCVLLYFSQSRKSRRSDKGDKGVLLSDTAVDRTLLELDEASGFFSGSLRSDDALRLVSNKVRDVVPFRTIVLYLLNDSRTKLVAVHADGERSASHKGLEQEFYEGLAGQSYTTRQVEIDNYMVLDDEQEFGSSVAIPLRHGENVFGIIQLFFDDYFELDPSQNDLFESIGTRVAPLMLGSIAYERTQANALTDVKTDLPNERAFYLVLEDQVAAAQNDRAKYPLTILAMDIRGFDEINCTFGHAAGDRVLNFVAQVIKDNLRQMDFVARALNDEFLVILPTADKDKGQEIIGRIQTSITERKLAINDTQMIEVELHVGWSAFGSDGETPGQLLSLAQLRKEQMKSMGPSNVLWFPQETRSSLR